MLLARPGCHLCDDARAVIERVAGELGVGWEERDITASPDDMREYRSRWSTGCRWTSGG
jgi:hypothetical protein